MSSDDGASRTIERPGGEAPYVATIDAVADEADEQVMLLEGVRTHNLKGISCALPHRQMTVVTGVSGSGKSSLAFDTLYAEGQRRYTESLSTYARQFIHRMERPPVDRIRNIQPAIALRQKNEVTNARSTVGTVTEINDLLELIFTHIGRTFCPDCDLEVRHDTVATVIEDLQRSYPEGSRLVLVAEVEVAEPKHRPMVLKHLVQEGHRRLWIDGAVLEIDDEEAIEAILDRASYPVIVDRLKLQRGEENLMRLSEAVEAGFALGKGRLLVHDYGKRDENDVPPAVYDQAFRCNGCGKDYVAPQPPLFSFNSSIGACPVCTGFGKTTGLDFRKIIPNPQLTLQGGAVLPFESSKFRPFKRRMLQACINHGIPMDLPWRKLDPEHQRIIREGAKGWPGVRGFFKGLQKKTRKVYYRVFIAKFRGYDDCEACQGGRLGPEARNVLVDGRPISDFWAMRIEQALAFFDDWQLSEEELARVGVLLGELRHRLAYLARVGLGYLILDRQSRTLSGGEMQRIHLTTSLGRALTDTLYVLDEPTAGLHAADSERLLKVLHGLRDLGNTVVVVEHDPEIIEGADYVIEIGPGGGERGGELMFQGPMRDFVAQDETITAQYLHDRQLPGPPDYLGEPSPGELSIIGACEHNLDNVTVGFPLERMSVVTGVSGSGKSTLLEEVLYNNWRRMRSHAGVEAGAVESIEGLDGFDDVVLMSQSSLGRSSRSNALSYTKAYDDIRRLFSSLESAKLAGLKIGDFSFNTAGGRCEHCEGTGTLTIEMHFMADVEITCPECEGKRFTERVLGVRYRDHNIHDVLEMTVAEGVAFFSEHAALIRKLQPLLDVGLGYLRMGQPTSTLSGGEAQRLKLATYIAAGRKRGDVSPVLFIFDEPTVGLHLADVTVLVEALRKLVAFGHTVLVIEHNTDFIAACDHVVDLGPGAGPHGGRIVAQGTPEEVAQVEESLTGQYLKELLG